MKECFTYKIKDICIEILGPKKEQNGYSMVQLNNAYRKLK